MVAIGDRIAANPSANRPVRLPDYQITQLPDSVAQPPRVSFQPVSGRDERGGTHEQTAEAQHDDDEVPERTGSIECWKIEAVESVIQPPVRPTESLFLAHDRAATRIEIQPRPVSIAVSRAQYRQRERARPVVVVPVVVRQPG